MMISGIPNSAGEGITQKVFASGIRAMRRFNKQLSRFVPDQKRSFPACLRAAGQQMPPVKKSFQRLIQDNHIGKKRKVLFCKRLKQRVEARIQRHSASTGNRNVSRSSANRCQLHSVSVSSI